MIRVSAAKTSAWTTIIIRITIRLLTLPRVVSKLRVQWTSLSRVRISLGFAVRILRVVRIVRSRSCRTFLSTTKPSLISLEKLMKLTKCMKEIVKLPKWLNFSGMVRYCKVVKRVEKKVEWLGLLQNTSVLIQVLPLNSTPVRYTKWIQNNYSY